MRADLTAQAQEEEKQPDADLRRSWLQRPDPESNLDGTSAFRPRLAAFVAAEGDKEYLARALEQDIQLGSNIPREGADARGGQESGEMLEDVFANF